MKQKSRYELIMELARYVHPVAYQSVTYYSTGVLTALLAYYQYKPKCVV